MASSNKDTFAHSLSNAKFSERNDAIFGGLSALEDKHEKEIPKDDPFSETHTKKGKHRIPPKVPDHVLHPEKWTKYSLEEDGTAEIAGALKPGADLNRDIAMRFIADLRQRKAMEAAETRDDMETSESGTCVGLKRKRDDVEKDEEKAAREEGNAVANVGSAVVMKTYEFGQKAVKKDGAHFKGTKTVSTETELMLSHLDDGDDNSKNEFEGGMVDEEMHEETKTKFHGVRKAKKNLRKTEPSDDD